MAAKSNSKVERGTWVYAMPIENVKVYPEVDREFCLDRVSFINPKKLPRIRKRLRIPEPLSALKGQVWYKDIFDRTDTLAVVRYTGEKSDAEVICPRLIREELIMLAGSNLGRVKRHHKIRVGVKGEMNSSKSLGSLFVNTSSGGQTYCHYQARWTRSLDLDGLWKKFTEEAFFMGLLRILRQEVTVADAWRKSLRRVAILLGQSMNANDVSTAFLANMIALEILLTRQGDKVDEALPRRTRAFLGWLENWEGSNVENQIREVYSTRCRVVHEGEMEAVTKQNLIFSDYLLLNLLTNITRFPDRYPSKDAVVEFTRLVEAEHLLGLPSGHRWQRFRAFNQLYTRRDIDAIA